MGGYFLILKILDIYIYIYIMTDHFKKYLKYKKKYNDLKKKLNGGSRLRTKVRREFITWNVAHECMFKTNDLCKGCNRVGRSTDCQNNLVTVFKNLDNRPHFIAIQEGNVPLANKIAAALNNKYTGHNWSVIYYRPLRSVVTAILIYDSTRFNKLTQFSGKCDNDNGRPFIGAKFIERSVLNSDGSTRHITVVSVHGPHVSKENYTSSPRSNGKKPILQQIINKAIGGIDDSSNRTDFFKKPCFIMGDFNTEFDIGYLKSPFNKLTHINNIINTCCSFPPSAYPDKRSRRYDNILYRINRGGSEGKTVALIDFGTFKNIRSLSNGILRGYNFPNNNAGGFRYSKYTSDHLPIAASFEIF